MRGAKKSNRMNVRQGYILKASVGFGVLVSKIF
jgi:hypothetical protein